MLGAAVTLTGAALSLLLCAPISLAVLFVSVLIGVEIATAPVLS